MLLLNQVKVAGGGANFPRRVGRRHCVEVEQDETAATTRGCCPGNHSNSGAAAQHKGLYALGSLVKIRELTVCRFGYNPGAAASRSGDHREWGRQEAQHITGGLYL